MKRICAILLAFCMLPAALAGCGAKGETAAESSSVAPVEGTTAEESKAPSSEPVTASESETAESDTTETSEETTSETEVLAPEEQAAETEALELAEKHGLTKEDLKGKYTLFLKFAETVEANADLEGYREFVYRIFPVVTDAEKYAGDHINEGSFLKKLSFLGISSQKLNEKLGGQFMQLGNCIRLNEDRMQNIPDTMPYILFHELMHFVDRSMVETIGTGAYRLDGKVINMEELSKEQREGAVLCPTTDFITEGGAEFFADKYFRGAPMDYPMGVTVMSALEYIMGEAYVYDLFFRWDTDAAFEDLLAEAGYSHEKCEAVCKTLNRSTYSDRDQSEFEPVSIIDMLIDLYECKLGDGWKTDEGFLFLLKNVDYYGGEYVAPSVRSESQTLFAGTKEWHSAFVEEMTKDIPEKPVPARDAAPYMKDGKIRMGCSADMTDPVTGEAFFGTISWEMDLKTGTRGAYYVTDYRGAAEKYFK